jgi:hypothetical protein
VIYAVFMMIGITAICSLCADYARVQLAKTELYRAADAAARYAAANLPRGVSAARSAAIIAAADNTVDSTPLTLESEDVEFGTWDAQTRKFTVLTGDSANNASAIRVTARRTSARGNAIPLSLARLFGQETCNVHATVTAIAVTGRPYAFIGLERFYFGNNFVSRSYNANAGTPGGSNLLASTSLGSNGTLHFGNNTDIYGDLLKGPSASLGYGNHFYLSGSQMTQSSAMKFNATETPSTSSTGALVLGNNDSITLSAGTYHYSSISAGNSATINTTGPVTIYVSGNITVGNNFTMRAHNEKPDNTRIRLVGSGKFESGNNLTVTAEVYGPGFEFNTGNNVDLRGAVIAREINGGNNAELYYDSSLNANGGLGGTIAVVE